VNASSSVELGSPVKYRIETSILVGSPETMVSNHLSARNLLILREAERPPRIEGRVLTNWEKRAGFHDYDG
jgi:hypothetical protein